MRAPSAADVDADPRFARIAAWRSIPTRWSAGYETPCTSVARVDDSPVYASTEIESVLVEQSWLSTRRPVALSVRGRRRLHHRLLCHLRHGV